MGTEIPNLTARIWEFVDTHVTFVLEAELDGRIDLSPRALSSLRVISNPKIVWHSLTGSGNETRRT